MKPFYLILCIILAFFILLFIYLNLVYSPVMIDKKIHKRTTSLLKAINNTDQNNMAHLSKSEPPSSKIWKNNLFDPLRGELDSSVSSSASSKEPSDMELIGTCNTTILKGAIILLKNKNFRYSSKLKGKPSPVNNKQRKRFFKIEERLPNGYTLKEVKANLVTLSKGNQQVQLKLKFDDSSTSGRVSSTTSNSVKVKLNDIKRAKNRSVQKKAKTSVKISPVKNKSSEIKQKPISNSS